MAAEPSPTADATRLIESARTSPTAKIPPRLVPNGESPFVLASNPSAVPVRTQSCASRITVSGNHAVRGADPMSAKIAAAGISSVVPTVRSRSTAQWSRPPPSSRVLTLAEPEYYVRMFVDQGSAMAALLQVAAQRRTAPAYVR